MSGLPDLQQVLETPENSFVRAKTVCTLTPALASVEAVLRLIDEGVNGLRILMSENDQKAQLELLRIIREAKAQRPLQNCAVLMETRGAELYLGPMVNSQPVTLTANQDIQLTNSQETGDSSTLTNDYEFLPRLLNQEDFVYLDEGAVVCQVNEVMSTGASLTVIEGGDVAPRKRITIPGAALNLQTLSQADVDDISNVALKHGVDFLILNQIRSTANLERVRESLANKGPLPKILIKLQNREVFEDFDSILTACDGLIISFFELSLAIPKHRLSLVLEATIAHANARGKPVLFMGEAHCPSTIPYKRNQAMVLGTMVVLGGDGIVIQKGTSVDQVVQHVQEWKKLCQGVEASPHYKHHINHSRGRTVRGASAVETACEAAVRSAQDSKAALIVVLPGEVFTVDMVVKYKPPVPLLLLAPQETPIACLLAGCLALKYPNESESRCVEDSLEMMKKWGLLSPGARVIVVSGSGFQNSLGTVKITAVS